MKILGFDSDAFFFILLAGFVITIAVAVDFMASRAATPPEVKRAEAADVSSRCDYVKFDGHEYVRYTDFNRAGLTHSPKCWCMTNGVAAR